MLARVINRVIDNLFGRLPAIAYLGPAAANPTASAGSSIHDLIDGIVFATPKRRNNIRTIWSKKYGDDNWKYGQKLWKPKRHIVSCLECGHFHEIHTICRNCFKKVQDESKEIIEKIRAAWGSNVIDQSVQVLYQGETATSTNKRIVELEKPRPVWFAPNLSQKTAQPAAQISSVPREADDRTIKVKEESKNDFTI